MKSKCENHQNCMKMIQAVLDGSATEEEMDHFKKNIDVCLPCIEFYELEKSVKNAMQQKVEKKCCPQSIIVDIKSKIGFTVLILGLLLVKIKLLHLIFNS